MFVAIVAETKTDWATKVISDECVRNCDCMEVRVVVDDGSKSSSVHRLVHRFHVGLSIKHDQLRVKPRQVTLKLINLRGTAGSQSHAGSVVQFACELELQWFFAVFDGPKSVQ